MQKDVLLPKEYNCERTTNMAYKIITTSPDVQDDQLRLEAARLVYEELLRYINSAKEQFA